MTSSVVSSVGAAPSGFEIVGASPATAETTGMTVSPLDDDIDIPPATVSPISMATTMAANVLRGNFMPRPYRFSFSNFVLDSRSKVTGGRNGVEEGFADSSAGRKAQRLDVDSKC